MSSGCATIFIRSDSASLPKHVYPATAFDAQFFWGCSVRGRHPIDTPDSTTQIHPMTRVAFGVGSTIDFPFSIVTDTIFFPADLYRLKATYDSSETEEVE
jgi:uncharacterized protein YceK